MDLKTSRACHNQAITRTKERMSDDERHRLGDEGDNNRRIEIEIEFYNII